MKREADVTEIGATSGYQQAIMGTWTHDPHKSRFSPGPAPRSHIRTYEPVGKGYKLTVEGIDGEGHQISWHYTANYDGKDYPVTGSDEVDTIALRQFDDRFTLGIFKKEGREVGLYARSLSEDGTRLTITTSGVSGGKPYYDVTVYHRQ